MKPDNFAQVRKWGAFYFLIAIFFATQNIGSAKELVVIL